MLYFYAFIGSTTTLYQHSILNPVLNPLVNPLNFQAQYHSSKIIVNFRLNLTETSVN